MSAERLPGEGHYREAVFGLEKYIAGYTTEQVRRELGLTDLVKLASNENAWGPSPKALAAITEELHNLWQYPEQSFFDLKHVLAEHNGVRPENVVVGHGTEVIIQLLPQLFCEAGDDVVVADLTYGRYAEAAKLMDARVQVVPLRDFHYDLAAVHAAIGPRTKLVFLCSPNNPTGCIVRRAEAEAFMAALPAGVTVVFDQAYREFVDDPEYADGLDLLKQGRTDVIVLRTFSKAYGLAGMRLGYALVPERVCWLLDTIKEPFNLNRLSIVAGPAALQDTEWLQECLRQTIAGRELLTNTLNAWGLHAVPSQANFVLFDSGEDAEELWGRLLRRGVIVRPCTGWGLTRHVRVTVGRPEQNERFLDALRQESTVIDGRPA